MHSLNRDFLYGYRYMLENMQVSRKSGDESRVLPVRVIESKLGQLLLTGGEVRLNRYRDELFYFHTSLCREKLICFQSQRMRF